MLAILKMAGLLSWAHVCALHHPKAAKRSCSRVPKNWWDMAETRKPEAGSSGIAVSVGDLVVPSREGERPRECERVLNTLHQAYRGG